MRPLVLVAPLNWGIGHASRVIPVIKTLVGEGFEVLAGISGMSGELLKTSMPDLKLVKMPSAAIRYGKKNAAISILYRLPLFFLSIISEHYMLRKIIRRYGVDIVISDNRYGLWNCKVYSVFITHQVFIQVPRMIGFLKPFIHKCTEMMIKRFDECWIPDYREPFLNFSGELSHGGSLPGNCLYIGLLSRFSNHNTSTITRPVTARLLVILSGPEPQRTIFETKIKDEIIRLKIRAIILRGLPSKKNVVEENGKIVLYNHVPDKEFQILVKQAGVIVCRPGYSTIMDLLVLGRSAILVPTPGQTEQEYLAGYLSAKGGFTVQAQNSLDLADAIAASKNENLNLFKLQETGHQLLTNAVKELRHKLRR
ncbi:MAG: glycosyltransferase [Bacteroidales bacterium]